MPVWIGRQSNLNWIFTQSNAQRLSDFTSPIATLSEIHKKPLNGGATRYMQLSSNCYCEIRLREIEHVKFVHYVLTFHISASFVFCVCGELL